MATFTGAITVPNPVPIVDRYGIFTAATGPLALPAEARGGGLRYETGTCGLPSGYDMQCVPPASMPLKTFGVGPATVTGLPFVVYASLECNKVGLDEQRVRTHLMERLKAGEQMRVEEIFSRQLNGQAPGLSGNAGVITAAASSSATKAVAVLEEAFYNIYGLPGTIHMPHLAAAHLQAGGALYKDGRLWKTMAGSTVSVGHYAGYSPANVAPLAGTVWIYMTGQVTIWRTPDSEIFMSEVESSFTRSTNVVKALVEREYVMTLDCSVVATLTTLPA